MEQPKQNHRAPDEKRFKRARRWFRIFLALSILGLVDAMPIKTGYDTDEGIVTVGAFLVFGNIVGGIVLTLLSLTILWIIFAFLSRRQMNQHRPSKSAVIRP